MFERILFSEISTSEITPAIFKSSTESNWKKSPSSECFHGSHSEPAPWGCDMTPQWYSDNMIPTPLGCHAWNKLRIYQTNSHDLPWHFMWPTWANFSQFQYHSGQISILPKPEVRGFGGDSLTKPPFKVTSARYNLSSIIPSTWFIFVALEFPRLKTGGSNIAVLQHQGAWFLHVTHREGVLQIKNAEKGHVTFGREKRRLLHVLVCWKSDASIWNIYQLMHGSWWFKIRIGVNQK